MEPLVHHEVGQADGEATETILQRDADEQEALRSAMTVLTVSAGARGGGGGVSQRVCRRQGLCELRRRQLLGISSLPNCLQGSQKQYLPLMILCGEGRRDRGPYLEGAGSEVHLICKCIIWNPHVAL